MLPSAWTRRLTPRTTPRGDDPYGSYPVASRPGSRRLPAGVLSCSTCGPLATTSRRLGPAGCACCFGWPGGLPSPSVACAARLARRSPWVRSASAALLLCGVLRVSAPLCRSAPSQLWRAALLSLPPAGGPTSWSVSLSRSASSCAARFRFFLRLARFVPLLCFALARLRASHPFAVRSCFSALACLLPYLMVRFSFPVRLFHVLRTFASSCASHFCAFMRRVDT